MLYPISKHMETPSQPVRNQLIIMKVLFYEEYVPGTKYYRKASFYTYIEVYMR